MQKHQTALPIGEPTATSIVSGGRKKVHYVYPDKTELIEEYDINTYELLVRRWKKHKDVGKEEWNYEIGEPTSQFNPDTDILAPSGSNPIFVRKDTPAQFQWRIRNLPWPKTVYLLEVDQAKNEIVVKTTNKKYYKRIQVPDLQRIGTTLDPKQLSWMYQNNTLIISYNKPMEIVEAERKRREYAKGLAGAGAEEGKVDCKQQ